MKRVFRRLAIPAALVAGIGVTATAMQTVQDPVAPLDAQAAEAPIIVGAESLALSFRSASRTALAGVVHVQVEAAPRQVSQRGPSGQNPFEGTPFEDFFRDLPLPSQPPVPRTGSGSGFIISPDGYVLTNNHVVENATQVLVTMTDRRQFEATVVGRDPNTDVAVLKIEGSDLPVVRIGSSDEMHVGDWVLALGYPLSLGETVTAGIVSAKGKKIGIMGQSNGATAPLEHFIQTDAAINPGNSGGPLVNLRGEAVGINSAIASPTGMYSGYGFAVPIQLAKRVADDLIRYGVVHRPRIGVEIDDVFPADIDALSLSNANGAVVRTLQDGPARDAGVRAGDVIVGVDGQAVHDSGDLVERLALRQPDDRVVLDIVRYGEPTKVTVRLGAFESTPQPTRAAAAPARDEVAQLGFSAAELTPNLARQMEIDGSGGVVITGVDRGGPAPAAALTGLRISRINGQEIRSVDDLRDVARGLEAGKTVSVVGLTPAGEEAIVNYRIR
jgi:serine protease Do